MNPLTPRSTRTDTLLSYTPRFRSLEHVAVAGNDERHFLVGDDHHRLQVAKIFVGAPVLRQLDRGAEELPIMAFELGLEPFEQGEGVGGGAREAANDAAFVETAPLFRVRERTSVVQGKSVEVS